MIQISLTHNQVQEVSGSLETAATTRTSVRWMTRTDIYIWTVRSQTLRETVPRTWERQKER